MHSVRGERLNYRFLGRPDDKDRANGDTNRMSRRLLSQGVSYLPNAFGNLGRECVARHEVELGAA